MLCSRFILATALAAALAGCQLAYPPAPTAGTFNPNMTAPTMVAPVAPTAATNPHELDAALRQAQTLDLAQSTATATTALNERVERVERAMIRLDRRMQIIERNELSRLGGVAPGMAPAPTPGPTSSLMPDMGLAPTSNPSFIAQGSGIPSAGALGTPGVSGSYSASQFDGTIAASPVAYQEGGIIGVKTTAPGTQFTQPGQALNSLPSLADGPQAEARGEVAIWTVNYPSQDKVWPERDQLAASRAVVDSLRQGQAVAVYARGNRPNAKVFRERVRALSRYLGRVAGQDSVPIATLPAEHLGEDTIEIMVTP